MKIIEKVIRLLRGILLSLRLLEVLFKNQLSRKIIPVFSDTRVKV